MSRETGGMDQVAAFATGLEVQRHDAETHPGGRRG